MGTRMKVRSGFVSNSSTSSFILYGFKITPDQRHEITGDVGGIYEWAEEHDLDFAHLDEYSYDLLGKYLQDWEGNGVTELSLSDLNSKQQAVQKELAGLNLGEPALFAGTRST